MPIKVGLISLGCAKNLVDSEIVLGMLDKADFLITQKIEEADILFLNTCGFILDSKRESIDAIIELAAYKKPLFVIGCLVERYKKELIDNFLMEDITFVSIKEYPQLNEIIMRRLNYEHIPSFNPLVRLLPSNPYCSYLRISEGCSNRCAFCAIPLIRGPFKSRKKEDILLEARWLKAKGVKEITLISQDSSHYGFDLYKDYRLSNLLKDIDKIGFYSIRLLYLYVDAVDMDFIQTTKEIPAVAPYFDLPLQHASNNVLKLMFRHGKARKYKELINTIRKEVPNAIIRSTFIVGFPGETKEDFQTLLDFVKDMRLDHIGVFMYSKEEGTASYKMPHQVLKRTKQSRYNKLMALQQSLVSNINRKHLNEEMEGLIVGYDKASQDYLVRTYFNAPDGIDGNIYLRTTNKHKMGDIVKIQVVDIDFYDLYAVEVN